MKPLFCNTGHHRVIAPKWIENVKSEKGITINCGVPKCKGKVKIKNANTDIQHTEQQSEAAQ